MDKSTLPPEIVEDFMSLGLSITELTKVCGVTDYISYATFRNALTGGAIGERSRTWIVFLHSQLFKPEVTDDVVDKAMQAALKELARHWPKKRNNQPRPIAEARFQTIVRRWLVRQGEP